MKRTIAMILSLSLLLALAGCGTKVPPSTEAPETTAATEPATEPEERCSSPILYKICDDDGHTAYLFGTAHAGLDEMYPLPDYVLQAYESADLLAVESDPNVFPSMVDMMQIQKATQLEEGTTIEDVISGDVYEAARKILQDHNTYDASMERATPIMWYMTIDELMIRQCEATLNSGVDRTMLNMASGDDKPVESVEPYLLHAAPLTDTPMEEQVRLLERVVEVFSGPAVCKIRDQNCRLWAKGDRDGLEQALMEDPFMLGMTSEDLTQFPGYLDALITRRDQQMVTYVKEKLSSGKIAFICVGIGHVVGDGGMVDQLIRDGYTVERV